MEDVKQQIKDFINKCEEVKNCKFIMATTKIKDVLKSIVNSRTLYQLFTSVSADFDYLTAKAQCLLDVSDGFNNRGVVILPESAQDKLAFIFCLLVEIDRDTINFNWFLQKYFSDDGSFYGSFYAFCDLIIDNLEKIIKAVFAKELEEEKEQKEEVFEEQQSVQTNSAKAGMLSAISLLIAQEKQFILESSIPAEDKEAGYKMLTEITKALKTGNFDLANALICGYNYYILYNNSVSQNVGTLFESIEEYESAV